MKEEDRKNFNAMSERLIRSAPTEEEREKLRRVKDQIGDMAHLMGAFDAWCQSQQIGKPMQATLCAYIISRNLSTIPTSRTRAMVVNWLCEIISEGINGHEQG